MLAPPSHLDATALTAALEEGWAIGNPVLDYLPVGFGSHHWRATDADGRPWFITVDEHHDASTIEDLRRAFSSASVLHQHAGLEFVLAPVSAMDGGVIRVLQDGQFTVSVTAWVNATPIGRGRFTSSDDRAQVLQLLGRLHAATSRIDPSVPSRIDLALADIGTLRVALEDIDEPWSSGPFGEPARALLRSDQRRLSDALGRYDELVEQVLSESASWVVTHGEPHTANVLRGKDGTLHLIDWDTARLAPRERDLWMVIEPATDLHPYRLETGEVPISAVALRLFRARWDLGEIAFYVPQFHRPHIDDPNTREAWDDLNMYLPVSDDHLAVVSG